MPAGTICLFVQGSVAGPAIPFGDGLRCAAGTLKRLYMLATPSGEIVVPPPASSPVSLRSAIEGDVLAAGSTRAYQVFYRDADPLFCPAPAGNTFDMSSGLTIVWAP
jgi:hypothetical protein